MIDACDVVEVSVDEKWRAVSASGSDELDLSTGWSLRPYMEYMMMFKPAKTPRLVRVSRTLLGEQKSTKT